MAKTSPMAPIPSKIGIKTPRRNRLSNGITTILPISPPTPIRV
jgi:hypothetical protein